MAATLTLSKIEIGFQYTTAKDQGIIENTGLIGYAGTNIEYHQDVWTTGTTIGPGYGTDIPTGGTFPIVQGGTNSTNTIIKNIKPTLAKRTAISSTSNDIDVEPYYNNGSYNNPSFTLNADDNNLVEGETLYLFPLIDITFDVSGDDGNFISDGDGMVTFLYLKRDTTESGEEVTVKDYSDTYSISANYLSYARYDDNYPYVLISSADNKLFPGSFNVFNTSNGVCETSGLFYHPAYDSYWLDNIVAYSRVGVGYGSNNNLYSYQGMSSITTDSYGKVTQFTIRCVCPTYMTSIVVPDAIYTGQATATVTLPITRRSNMTDTASILSGTQREIQFTVTRNQLESRTVMPYSISTSFYENYNKVYTKCLSDGGKVTEFTLQDIGSYRVTDDTYPYSNYKNLIYTPSEKYDITYYSSDDLSLVTKYGDTLLKLCKKNISYDPDKDFIYEYFLYYKPSMSDIQNYNEFIKKIVLETIDVDYNPKDLKDFEQLDVTCYWFPNARKLAEGISFSGVGNPSTASTVRDSITIANNALMSYPIGTDVMLGYSNYYLRLTDLNEVAWYNFANANLQYTYTHKPDGSGTGTMQFNLSDAFDSSAGMQDMYSDYNAFLTSLRVQFYNNVIDDDNILFTSIPILIRVKTTTKGKDEYNEVYLIKIIVDLRKLRAEKTNNLKLLSNSDFIKSGYFRSTYDSNPDSSSRLFTDLFLDNSADSDVSNKVMSPIDIINKDLYVFDPEGKHIKTITIDDINNLEGSSVKYNTFINYVDMYNITNANSTSTLVDSKDLQYVVEHSYANYWISEEEYQYMTDILPNVPLLSSVFNTDHPVNSYKSCTENFDPNVGLILKNPEKGYGISVLASISKDYSSILDGGAADSLLTPLSRYDDIFLSTESLTNCHIICMYDTQPLSKSIIITNPRNIS